MFVSSHTHPAARPVMTAKPHDVKLITGLLSNDPGMFCEARRVLTKAFGPVDSESDVLEFTHTDYYRKEFGDHIKRVFFSFKRHVSCRNAYRAKLTTRRLEKKFISGGKRRINIDPGYLSLAKLVLFSTKDHVHRMYMDKGIYAEVTLRFLKHSFAPWPWTYPDYATREYIDFFNRVRGLYYAALKQKER